MANYADRVKDVTTTTGTGSLTLSGTAPTDYQSFANAFSVNDRVYYTVEHLTTGEWEVGRGTLTGATTLARTTVLASSNSGSAVDFTAGSKTVFCTLPASQAGAPGSDRQVPFNDAGAWGTSAYFKYVFDPDFLRGQLILSNGDDDFTSVIDTYKVLLSGTDSGITYALSMLSYLMRFYESGPANSYSKGFEFTSDHLQFFRYIASDGLAINFLMPEPDPGFLTVNLIWPKTTPNVGDYLRMGAANQLYWSAT